MHRKEWPMEVVLIESASPAAAAVGTRIVVQATCGGWAAMRLESVLTVTTNDMDVCEETVCVRR